MSGVIHSDAVGVTELYRELRRELSSVEESTISTLVRELRDIGVHVVDDLKEVKKCDIEKLSLRTVQRRKLSKYIDRLNGVVHTSSAGGGGPKNYAAIICATGSDEAQVHLIRSNITINAGKGGPDDVKNKAVFGEGNIRLTVEDTPITVDAGEQKTTANPEGDNPDILS